MGKINTKNWPGNYQLGDIKDGGITDEAKNLGAKMIVNESQRLQEEHGLSQNAALRKAKGMVVTQEMIDQANRTGEDSSERKS